MSGHGYDENLAYGSYSGQNDQDDERSGDRGIIGDVYNSFRGRRQPATNTMGVTEQYQPQLYSQQPQTQSTASFGHGSTGSQQQRPSTGGGGFNLGKLESALHKIGSEVKTRISGPGEKHSHTHVSGECIEGSHDQHFQNRFCSFAPERQGNDAKWYVDACGYMWAVSRAIEAAKDSIWILDWWLSPELYLRRPPSKNEKYRVDRMLKAAAERGVKVRIIVYKEVTQALTRKLKPAIHPHLASLIQKNTPDKYTSFLSRLGLDAIFHSLEQVERTDPLIEPPITVSSWHTKHALEDLHPNIQVFRHPDHLPDTQVLNTSFIDSIKNMKLTAATAAQLPGDALKALYGVGGGTVLYWAHHEKLCLVDNKTAFMGGIDLCYGRWDTNQHSIADAHPGDLSNIVFPGQDYNNARIMDFQDVAHWENNKLDRTKNSRMGWTDLSISLHGPVVVDFAEHFAQRWNFIFYEKYGIKDAKYAPIDYQRPPGLVANSYPPLKGPAPTEQQEAALQGKPVPQPQYASSQPQSAQQSFPPPPSGQQPYSSPQSSQPAYGQHNFPPPPAGQPSYSEQNFPPPPPNPPPSQQYEIPPQATSSASATPYFAPPPTQASRGVDEQSYGERGFDDEYGESGDRSLFGKGGSGGLRDQLKQRAQAGLQQFDARYGQKLQGGLNQMDSQFGTHVGQYTGQYLTGQDNYAASVPKAGISCQATRSCAKWSHGVSIEHSVANAYIEVIRKSRHFIYIENQFFITANVEEQRPIKNRIGAAIVERIIRAAHSGQKYKVIVLMPAVPAFAGDLRSDEALSTRAIMEFQYDSISRGGHSIYQQIAKAGFNPLDYIRFYNLRNYDRINTSAVMAKLEQQTGFSYEDARKQHDAMYGGGYATDTASRGIDEADRGYQAYNPNQQQAPSGVPSSSGSYAAYQPPPGQSYPPPPSASVATQSYGATPLQYNATQQQHGYQSGSGTISELPADVPGVTQGQGHGSAPSRPPAASTTGYGEKPQYPAGDPYHQYQQAAQNVGDHKGLGKSGRWDSVAECYMLDGPDIREVPWENGTGDEMEAFVSEELYIHSKLLIADDRICIIGSANLNDRSQLGDHDSEIAVIVEDSSLIESRMNGKSFQVNRFAASLRRTLFRKHLGLLKPQNYESLDANFEPVGVSPNDYDWGSDEDRQVVDPLDDRFLNMWNTTAHTNTTTFAKCFHPVPYDGVRTWSDYDDWYEKYFRLPDSKDVKEGKKQAGTHTVGHVVRTEFAQGPEGVKQLKDELAKIRGTLVEMPLVFLKDEDIAKEGLSLNAFTAEVYT